MGAESVAASACFGFVCGRLAAHAAVYRPGTGQFRVVRFGVAVAGRRRAVALSGTVDGGAVAAGSASVGGGARERGARGSGVAEYAFVVSRGGGGGGGVGFVGNVSPPRSPPGRRTTLFRRRCRSGAVAGMGVAGGRGTAAVLRECARPRCPSADPKNRRPGARGRHGSRAAARSSLAIGGCRRSDAPPAGAAAGRGDAVVGRGVGGRSPGRVCLVVATVQLDAAQPQVGMDGLLGVCLPMGERRSGGRAGVGDRYSERSGESRCQSGVYRERASPERDVAAARFDGAARHQHGALAVSGGVLGAADRCAFDRYESSAGQSVPSVVSHGGGCAGRVGAAATRVCLCRCCCCCFDDHRAGGRGRCRGVRRRVGGAVADARVSTAAGARRQRAPNTR
eukprot:ctg_3074.g604